MRALNGTGRLTVAALAAGALAVMGMACPGAASADAAGNRHLVLDQRHHDARVPVIASQDGEAVLDIRVSAAGTDWAQLGRESAVVSLYADDRYETDLVVSGAAPLDRQFALGR